MSSGQQLGRRLADDTGLRPWLPIGLLFGDSIYGNCLFALDPAARKLAPVKIDNWTKTDTKTGGYRTLALAENDDEPNPCPRHVYHAFEYVPDLQAVFLCNGANQTALRKDGTFVGHDLCDSAWRLDLKTNTTQRTSECSLPVAARSTPGRKGQPPSFANSMPSIRTEIPPHKNWFGWMQLCYDSHHDCLIGKVNEKFFVFRYVPWSGGSQWRRFVRTDSSFA